MIAPRRRSSSRRRGPGAGPRARRARSAATAPRPPARRSRAARTRGRGRSPPAAGPPRTAARQRERRQRGEERHDARCRRTPGTTCAGSPPSPPRSTTAARSRRSATIAPTIASRRPLPSGRRAISSGRRVDLGAQDAHEAQVAVALAVVEPVADDELVGDLEAHVVHRDVDQPPRGLVEQRADPERGRALAAQVADEVVERQAGVDDVLDEQDVLVGDARPTGP